jgi:hypothetical protein
MGGCYPVEAADDDDRLKGQDMMKMAVVVAVLVFAAACGSDGDDSSCDAAEALGIAQGFVEAQDAWDGEGVRSPSSSGGPVCATSSRSAPQAWSALRSR